MIWHSLNYNIHVKGLPYLQLANFNASWPSLGWSTLFDFQVWTDGCSIAWSWQRLYGKVGSPEGQVVWTVQAVMGSLGYQPRLRSRKKDVTKRCNIRKGCDKSIYLYIYIHKVSLFGFSLHNLHPTRHFGAFHWSWSVEARRLWSWCRASKLHKIWTTLLYAFLSTKKWRWSLWFWNYPWDVAEIVVEQISTCFLGWRRIHVGT